MNPAGQAFVRAASSGLRILALGLTALCASTVANAAWPERPIRFLVGFAPGGSGDIIARLLAQRLMGPLGQPVVVENRLGAGGAIAAEATAKAAPDGYTWSLIPSGHATQGAMLKAPAFDPVNGLAWVSTITTYPLTLAVAPNSPYGSLAELLAEAKRHPGKLTYSSVGNGTAHHLLGEWINAEAGVDLVHVPFKGGTAALTETMAGRLDLMIETVTLTLPYLRAGKIRGLAVSSARALDGPPALPALADTVPGVVFESWQGVATTPGTRPEIIARINAEIRAALAHPEVQRQLADLGGGAVPSTPDEFRARVERDITRFRRVVDTRGIERQ
jgi:tripartite-type tricarboxylate transporter receptor subunit TctC